MLRLYNTLSRKKEIFKPISPGRINIFACGPTVYDSPHIGHGRFVVFCDAFVKYLRALGFKVFYLQNITDIDDKIINKAKEESLTPEKVAKKYEKEYMKAMKDLKINSVSKYARATFYIREIISQVKRLLDKKIAYKIKDGIYYDIKKFKNYGKLSGRTVLQAEDGISRIDEAIDKKNKGDFCLWKFSKPGEPKWKSPWGDGRPGWHIEDTAITEKYFGPQYDIHLGGKDLMFPHHEAEIAQMEAISGKSPMVRYWIHVGFLTVDGRKMSKSLNNFITVNDFIKNNSARLLRFFFLKVHYRSPIDYTENNLSQAKRELERIDEFVCKAKSQKSKVKSVIQNSKLTNNIIKKAERDFYKAMEDDINTPSALAAVFKLINQTNQLLDQEKLSYNEIKEILNFLKNIDKFLDFIFWKEKAKKPIPEKVKKLVKEREVARKNKKWAKADELRNKIEKLGYKLEDTKEGTVIKKNL